MTELTDPWLEERPREESNLEERPLLYVAPVLPPEPAEPAESVESQASAQEGPWRHTVDGGYAEQFARMAIQLHDEPGIEETIERVLEFALQAVACDFAGAMLIHGGDRFEAVASTDPLVDTAHGWQLECGEGPCLAAIREHECVMIPDIAADQRFPAWSARAAGLGLRSALSLRLQTGNSTVGALSLFDTEPGIFDDDDAAVAHILARHASIAIAQARHESNLWQAVDARKLVGQAQGILMERFDLSADQAFAVLRRYSQDNNIKLRHVAERLVTTRKLGQN